MRCGRTVTIEEYGETDAYGHRHKVDIGHALAEEVRKKTGSETMASDLTYDLRSGDPDAIDELVAITYANIALDLIYDNITGRMVGIQNGCYAHIPLPDLAKGARRVNVSDGLQYPSLSSELFRQARGAAAV